MKQKDLIHIERNIATGMIISDEFLRKIREIIDIDYVQSKEAQIIMGWCLEHFDKYEKAPTNDIKEIFIDKLRTTNIQKASAQIIEEILEDLSDDYVDGMYDKFNADYLMERAILYCKATKLKTYAESIEDEVAAGNILEAENNILQYQAVEELQSQAVTPLGSIEQVKECFAISTTPLIELPGKVNGLGDMINPTLIKEGFVIYLAQNKGGKSFHLMRDGILSAKQGYNVAFFQAGDMSQAQMEKRMAIGFARKSDQAKYCGNILVPVIDCWKNQTGKCDKSIREGGLDMEAPFEGNDAMTRDKWLTEFPFDDCVSIWEDYSEHVPCHNCKRNRNYRSFEGSIWWKERPKVDPLTWKEAYKMLNKKHKHIIKRIKLITYPSETLTMSKVNMELGILEKQGFIPSVIIMDYMDLLAPDNDTKHLSLRDQENKKWQRARRLSQEKKVLVLSASQSDTKGFTTKVLAKNNFSEDRRKLDHVTAMYGLNMNDEEKKKGIMRVNDIVGRDTEGGHIAYVMHRLQMGQPILGSFY